MKHNGHNYLPIIFSMPMVRAILEGRKTQTRRLHEKPACAVGDRLWVRETWRPRAWDCEGFWCIEYQDGKNMCRDGGLFADDPYGEKEESLILKICEELDAAGVKSDEVTGLYHDPASVLKWRPSIHMPFGAHRIELEVTEVRRERLQDISAKDAIAEGIEYINGQWRNYTGFTYKVRFPEDSFFSLWSSIYGYNNWESNPYVYAYTFKRLLP